MSSQRSAPGLRLSSPYRTAYSGKNAFSVNSAKKKSDRSAWPLLTIKYTSGRFGLKNRGGADPGRRPVPGCGRPSGSTAAATSSYKSEAAVGSTDGRNLSSIPVERAWKRENDTAHPLTLIKV